MGKGRRPCCDKASVKTGPWSEAEDFKLISFIQKHGHDNWRALPKLAGLPRCGKSCRLRWVNYLRPDLKRGNFTPHEEEAIIKLHEELGNKWSKIASKLPGRTDNEIKNVWNTHLKKRIKDKECSTKSQQSCKSLSTRTSTNEALDVSSKDDCWEQTLIHQTSTVDDDTMEHSSSSSTPYYPSQPPSLGHEMEDFDLILDDLGTPGCNMVESNCDKDEAGVILDTSIESSTLEELIEIPFEPNLDLWDLLDADQSSSGDISDVHFSEVDAPLQLAIDYDDKSSRSNNMNDTDDGGCRWWLVYLENELGLDHNEATSAQ